MVPSFFIPYLRAPLLNYPAPISRSLSAGALNGGAVKYYWMHLNHCTAWNISPRYRENPSCSPAGGDICYNSLRVLRQDDRFVIKRVWMSFLCWKKLLPTPSSERKNTLHIDRKSHREFWIYKMHLRLGTLQSIVTKWWICIVQTYISGRAQQLLFSKCICLALYAFVWWMLQFVLVGF